jgi:hypothetical protein
MKVPAAKNQESQGHRIVTQLGFFIGFGGKSRLMMMRFMGRDRSA